MVLHIQQMYDLFIRVIVIMKTHADFSSKLKCIVTKEKTQFRKEMCKKNYSIMYYTKNIIKTERWLKERKMNIVKKWNKSWLILPGGKFCGFVWEKLVLWCCKDCVEFSFSNKSAKPLDDSSHGSKPIEINNIP